MAHSNERKNEGLSPKVIWLVSCKLFTMRMVNKSQNQFQRTQGAPSEPFSIRGKNAPFTLTLGDVVEAEAVEKRATVHGCVLHHSKRSKTSRNQADNRFLLGNQGAEPFTDCAIGTQGTDRHL